MEDGTPAEPPAPSDAEPPTVKRLDRAQIELPDGRYLLLYSRRLPSPPET